MNLQSKFDYCCIFTETLIIGLCKLDGIMDSRTNGQTGQTIRSLDAPGAGIEINVCPLVRD